MPLRPGSFHRLQSGGWDHSWALGPSWGSGEFRDLPCLLTWPSCPALVSWRHHERPRPGPAAAQRHGRGLGLTELSRCLTLRWREVQPLKPRCPSGRGCRRRAVPHDPGGRGADEWKGPRRQRWPRRPGAGPRPRPQPASQPRGPAP